ncbi:fructose bisphosphate aldolase [Rhodobacteraceae bacterium W635]|uniref:fructose bisphosphate aldolase n=1 Tax=Nioella halotolerans TaxID=2303578 RepID=UPI000E3DE63C|nr:fructose bisphosphate aldolase [Rhodobacteraceae bacterium W635]
MPNQDQTTRIRAGQGFIAALDQSGGSTPRALSRYGIPEGAYKTEAEMFDLIHQMRSRIITAPAFGSDRIIAAILFEMTMDREVEGMPTATYLWQERGIVPFLKIDKGLAAEADGCQVMKPIADLDATLERAVAHGIYGTKMRSVVGAANAAGIKTVVAQQFDVAQQIIAHDLVPIIEPEVTISIPDKAEAEEILRAELLAHLDAMPGEAQVMLKLTLPEVENFYKPLVDHPRVLKVVALSGGDTRDEANALLARQTGIIASFSRALTEGLSAQQTDAEFNATLDAAIQSTYEASIAG